MTNNVFPQDKVGDFFNKHFINMKVDMEKGEGVDLRRQYGVSAYPTLLLIDAEGAVVQQIKGARGADAGVYDDRGTEKVFIPFTDFKGDAYDAGYTPRGATITNTRGALLAVWPGIDGKRVTHVIVHTSANISRSVTPFRLTPGTFTALLSTAGNSNTNLQPTRWTCAVGESYGIIIAPGATNIFIQGATLTLG